MKLLLDENMPLHFRRCIPVMMSERWTIWAGREKSTARFSLWPGTEFDTLITLDQKIESQQNLTDAGVAVIVLRPGTDDIDTLRALVPQILELLLTLRRGEVVIYTAYIGGLRAQGNRFKGPDRSMRSHESEVSRVAAEFLVQSL